MKSIRKILTCWLAVLLLAAVLLYSGCSKKVASEIFDSSNALIATFTDQSEKMVQCSNDGYRAYLDIVIQEAVEIFCENKQCSSEQAEQMLQSEGYTIQTVFDPKVYEAMENA